MGSPAERDKQPSTRYVERLADEVADRVMAIDGLVDHEASAGQLDSLRRHIYWVVLEAGVEMRRRNVDR